MMNDQLRVAACPSANSAAGWRKAILRLAPFALAALLDHALTAANLTASLNRDTVTLGESATLSLTFAGATPAQVPEAPSVPNLSISYIGQSSQFSFVNGRSSSTLTYNFLVRAAQPGDYTIPAITATVGGTALKTQLLTLKVLKSGEAGSRSDLVGKTASLKLVVPRTEAYLGEVLPVEIQLYAKQGRLKRSPQLTQEGFTIGKMIQQPETRTLMDNQYYNLLVYKTYVAAAKTGQLELGPATLALAIPHPQSRVSFFGEPVDWIDADLASDPLTLNILPLPTNNVPADFNGAVGNFMLNATVSTNVVTAGDPITVTVRIAGRGVIESLALVCIDKWRDFKTYSPVTKVETSDPFGLQGGKTFEQVVIPENAEVKELPPITFSFFDPDQKAYRTVSHPATPISVRPDRAPAAQPTIVASPAQYPQEPKPATDIVHIKARPGIIGQIRPPLIQQPLFLAVQGLPVLVWAAVLIWRNRQDRLANNPRLRRKQRVTAAVRSALGELRRQAAANQSDEVYATMFRLLQEQLGERLDMPASAITEAVIEERLRPRGLTPETLVSLHELFQTCNQARYAPQRSSEELASLVPKVEATLTALRELKD